MKSIFVSKSKIVFYFLSLLLPLTVYSQTLELRTQENGSKLILQQKETSVVRIIPSSGINYDLDFDMGQPNEERLNGINSLNWELKFSASGKVFKDVSFATPLVGYIVTELGAVYKTTDGGNNWTSVMNLGFPYYWYGVDALTLDTLVISGFDNQGNIHSGVVRWSFNGGTSWTSDIILRIPSGVGWLSHIHFFDSNKGIVSAEFSGGMHYTTNGGKDTTSWQYVQINSDLGWFAGNIDTDSSGNIFTTGIHFAHSSDYGLNWTSAPSADAVFDGGVDFLEDLLMGMTGGGQISAPVSGWTHKTTDGGQSWSQRLYSFPYPIRAVKLFNDTLGLAFGGNLYQEAGGVYITTDGGGNWNLDISTLAEMFSYDVVSTSPNSIDVWCVGSTGGSTGFTGKLYKTSIGTVVGIDDENIKPDNFQLFQNYPNPFNPNTVISYQLPVTGNVTLKVFDILGNEVATLVNEEQAPGVYEVEFNIHSDESQNLTSGIYFYQLRVRGPEINSKKGQAGQGMIETKKMILLK